jgi:diguanylate cyclase (GGDEF)-like protein
LPDFLGDTAYARAKPFIDQAMTGQRTAFENALEARNGTMHVLTTLIPNLGENAKVEGFYILSQDMTERKLLERRLVYEATHDSLTSLPNRRAFTVRLGEAVARTQRNKQGLALLFLDLDGFKSLNDHYGHEFGDHVLQHFAALLSEAVRQTDTVARLAGDEFTIILEGLDEPEAGAIRVAEKILTRLAKPCSIDGIELTLAASIGGTTANSGNSKIAIDSLLAKADSAMYRAKAAGKGRFALN